MSTTTQIDHYADLIDSRDVIARIEELESELDALEAEEVVHSILEWKNENGEELAALKALAEEASGYAADWQYGETLIRDSYFRDYAMQLADDIGAIPSDLAWPCTCIDWDQAARELQMDYSAVEFNGITYWIR